MNKAVFLDRDGTINKDIGYLYKIEDLELLPGVIQAIKILNDSGFLVIVITNQSGVARGYYSEMDIKLLHNYINNILNEYGANIDAFYYCPHHPEKGIGKYKVNCNCRKPKPGLIENAIEEFKIDRSKSYMVGDKKSDVEAGKNANLKDSYLIDGQKNLLQIVNYIIDNI
jgi:D,D-heptose 1,7-bisphosphate phosphatase